LPNGIPSHDTFNRFFSALDPDEFEQVFLSWIKEVSELTDGDVVSIDGKTVCGSRGVGSKRAIHIVSAWYKITEELIKANYEAKSSVGTRFYRND
jgi:hypothetical protein